MVEILIIDAHKSIITTNIIETKVITFYRTAHDKIVNFRP